MALKSITLRLDEEEYEKLKAHLAEFGDPGHQRSVRPPVLHPRPEPGAALHGEVRDRLKNYFGLLGSWLKQLGSMTDLDVISRSMAMPWKLWNAQGGPAGEQERS